ncbi:hypothetical protein BRADI_5g10671v3 [Brachypodium distachyon]|uniref:Uncharacterized protein n=1 Tax=Brachypodium distachyon TaxID=15368 RepID=A0A2K2CGH6_BRADI|nr:hypothetical protein BRADI_5g10671v3 [Brachypodium distachyon]
MPPPCLTLRSRRDGIKPSSALISAWNDQEAATGGAGSWLGTLEGARWSVAETCDFSASWDQLASHQSSGNLENKGFGSLDWGIRRKNRKFSKI